MSLKAKLEAVIYASEEPVTLAQLAGLFADEALEWKAEQAAAAQAEAEEPAADENENSPLVQDTLPDLTVAPDAAEEADASEKFAESAGEDAGATVGQEADATNSETGAEAAGEDASAPDADQAEAEAKRAAKLRDREARGVIRQLLDELIAEYAIDGRGIEIREIAGGYRMATKPECHDAVRSFVRSLKPALKLSLPALETLAVIAYKQPVTIPEVNEIRGVDSSAVFGSLLARKLIATAGRKQVIGRPILYKTTREFLLRFGLKDVAELPSMEEFEKMAVLSLDEQEPPAEGESAPEIRQDLSLELDEIDDQPGDEFLTAPPETPEPAKTAGTAASNEPQPTAEAAPAAPSPTEQAETETSTHDEKDQEDR